LKKQTILYSLSLAGATIGACAAFSLNKDYQKSRANKRLLQQIMHGNQNLVSTPGTTYLGNWSLSPTQSTSTEFHFGFNYQKKSGQVEVHEFWANPTTGKVLKTRIYELK
jgi:hypothetical protein